jgi:hypothetical protein
MKGRIELIQRIIDAELPDEAKAEHIKLTYNHSDDEISILLAIANGEIKEEEHKHNISKACPPHYPDYTKLPIRCLYCSLLMSQW